MNIESKFSYGNSALLVFVIALIWLSFFLMRWFAPQDLLDKDQQRPAAYMADAALNGNWIVQVDDHGDVTSKPPVYTWIGAILILLAGRTNNFALYFPTALSVLGCCLLIWHFGRRKFSPHAAFIGAIALLVCPLGLRIFYLARTDAMFSLTTFLTACIGYGCRQKGWNWVWFWLAAALATLTKGPLGLVLASAGLVGLFRKSRPMGPRTRVWLQHGFGVVLYLIISLGWLWLAYRQLGDAVIAKIIGRELFGHTNWTSQRFSSSYFFLFIPTLYFLSRFFPWSIPAAYGVWRVWKRPAEDPEERSFECFLAAYLCLGISMFSIFPHQRPDLLFPLLPAASLLAGRELYRWLSKANRIRYSFKLVIGFWMIMLAVYSVYYFKIDPATNHWFEKTAGVKEIAEKFKSKFGTRENLYFVDVPYGLQYYLNTMKVRTPSAVAAQKLSEDKEIFVAVNEIEELRKHVPPNVKLHTIMRWPAKGRGFVYILSNRAPEP